jgi:hypothetical protein
MGLSPKSIAVIKKAFLGEIMVFSFFVYLYQIFASLKVMFEMDALITVEVWQLFLKNVVIGELFVVMMGLCGNVIGNMKKDKAIKEFDQIRKDVRVISASHSRVLTIALTSEDSTVRAAAKLEALKLIEQGVTMFDYVTQVENIEAKEAMSAQTIQEKLEEVTETQELDEKIDEAVKLPPPPDPPIS